MMLLNCNSWPTWHAAVATPNKSVNIIYMLQIVTKGNERYAGRSVLQALLISEPCTLAQGMKGWKLSRQSPAAEIGSTLIKIWCRNNRKVGIPKFTKVKGKNSTPRRVYPLGQRANPPIKSPQWPWNWQTRDQNVMKRLCLHVLSI